MKKITIFTPTYNRKEYLKKLYNSLINQTNKNFIWLIVDDGSVDGTDYYINKLIEENKIEIKYIKQKNSGKYIAYNTAINEITTEYNCCIDSDDWLLEEAIDIIYKNLEKIKFPNIGLVYPRNKLLNISIDKINISDFKLKYNLSIETTIVMRTEISKKILFPVNNNEKFMSEEILYNELAKYGYFIFVNNIIVEGEYLKDGMTKNLYKLWVNSYNNSMLLFKSRYEYINNNELNKKLLSKIKCVINCNIVNLAKKNNCIKNTPSKLLSFLFFIPSLIIYYKIKRKMI